MPDRRDACAEDLSKTFREELAGLYRFAKRLLGDGAEAEDAVQEAFLRLARRVDRPDGATFVSARAFVFRIVRNVCLDRLRARAWRAQVFSEDGVCGDCAHQAAEIDLVNVAVRASETRQTVPPSLNDWIDAREREGGARTSRRRTLGGLALAASALAAAIVVTRGRGGGQQAMETTLFRDFATLVAADSPLDFEDRDPDRVLAWFETRIPFALPRLPAAAEIGIRGGRLCWLLDRRVAALHLGSENDGACLYTAEAEDLALRDGTGLPAPGRELAVSSERALAGAFWRDGRLAFGLVAEAPEDRMARGAPARRRTGRPPNAASATRRDAS